MTPTLIKIPIFYESKDPFMIDLEVSKAHASRGQIKGKLCRFQISGLGRLDGPQRAQTRQSAFICLEKYSSSTKIIFKEVSRRSGHKWSLKLKNRKNAVRHMFSGPFCT